MIDVVCYARYGLACRNARSSDFCIRMGYATVAKKKTQKKIKRLKKTAKALTTANMALEKQVRKLKKKLVIRKQQIADLQESLSQPAPINTAPIETEKSPPTAEIGADNGTSVATSQRVAWKQHKYLRDRYEFHLDTGATKESARQLANDDLEKEFGASSGYSEDELSAILS